MKVNFFRRFDLYAIHIRVAVLAFAWCAGMLIGMLFAFRNGAISAPITVQLASREASLLLLLCRQYFPFLIIWVLVFFKLHLLTIPVCLFTMMSFGYCAGSVYCAFGSAGWLICLLMLFSQVVTLVPLFWVAMKCLTQEISYRSLIWVLLSFGILLVSVMDYLLVSPFLSSLISLV